eukprot:scaffold2989_cov387-Prasinococcus_capsulatus_cf.AAC.6
MGVRVWVWVCGRAGLRSPPWRSARCRAALNRLRPRRGAAAGAASAAASRRPPGAGSPLGGSTDAGHLPPEWDSPPRRSAAAEASPPRKMSDRMEGRADGCGAGLRVESHRGKVPRCTKPSRRRRLLVTFWRSAVVAHGSSDSTTPGPAREERRQCVEAPMGAAGYHVSRRTAQANHA